MTVSILFVCAAISFGGHSPFVSSDPAASAAVTALGNTNGFTLRAAKSLTLSDKALARAERASAAGKIDASKKSISFGGKSADMVVTTGPEKDMMSYRIRGLRNPKLTVKAGATLHVLFVNTDDDMLHSFRITNHSAPFDAKLKGADSVGSKALPHKSSKSFYGQELSFKVPDKAGSYSYVCTVAGHAAAGMFGTIVVK